MIEVYKLVKRIYDNTVEPVFHLWFNRYELRGNSLKLFLRMCTSEMRKIFLHLVLLKHGMSFKNRLDKFWSSRMLRVNINLICNFLQY